MKTKFIKTLVSISVLLCCLCNDSVVNASSESDKSGLEFVHYFSKFNVH